MTVRRLDLALVDAGLARSRTQARRIIEEGRARVDGHVATKPSTPTGTDTELRVVDVPGGIEYASRAAHKLDGAIAALRVDVAGRCCLDIGASTGGFTDILLRHGARSVVAVDIGHDQLAAHLRADPRVHVLDGTSIRGLTAADVGGEADVLVADLSFISLTTVITELAGLTRIGGDLLLMVKPQFEVGRQRLPRNGVVRDIEDRRRSVREVAASAGAASLVLRGAGRSPLAGQDGNVEYFLHLRRAVTPSPPGTGAYDMIDQAVDGSDVATASARSDREGRTT